MIEKKQETFSRLSPFVLPTHYVLSIKPDLRNFKFTGSVKIDLDVTEEVEAIELHSVNLHLTNIQFKSGQVEYRFERIETNQVNESIRIYFDQSIKPGSGALSIDFDGELNQNLSGFYRSKCTSRDGKLETAAVTQFESTYARKAFPCFDEPEFKATFDITIIADSTKTVLSNMPVKNVEKLDEMWSKFEFDRSPIMSTYLVAFVIGDYDYIETVSSNNTQIRVYTPIGKTDLGAFSLDLTAKSLAFYEEYFGIKYPLPKLDLIALADLEIEAMENYGLLTFKESLLLVDSNKFSIKTKYEVALVVVHEIAHQWFGNLVTMKWWTDLWLNEGFATWVQYLCVDHVFPHWNIWSYYDTNHRAEAYNLDSLKSSHPIEVPINAPTEIGQIFDSISYCKGSCVLRMLNEYVGEANFRQGLQNYLNKFKFRNASSNDLWTEIDLAAPEKCVKELMQDWTKKQGFPILSVSKRVNEQNHTILQLKQSRFLRYTSERVDSGDIWNIPISIGIGSTYPSVHTVHLMNSQTTEIDLGILKPHVDWIRLNLGNFSFYVIKYSSEMFEDLLASLNSNPNDYGSPADRISLLNDAFLTCWSGDLSGYDLLRLLETFKNETNPYVWVILLNNVDTLMSSLLGTPFFDKFAHFVNSIMANIYKNVGIKSQDNENYLKRLLREHVLYTMAKLGDQSLQQYAKELFSRPNFVDLVPLDSQKGIYISILQQADEKTIEHFIELYKKSPTPEEKEKIALLLGEVSTNDQLIGKVLEFALSPHVTYEETVYIMVAVASNSTCQISTQLVWSFVKKNWTVIFSRYYDSILLGRCLKGIIENFDSLDIISDIEEFFVENIAPEATMSIKQGIESIRANANFLSVQEREFTRFFDTYST